jgi:hypothetical protein
MSKQIKVPIYFEKELDDAKNQIFGWLKESSLNKLGFDKNTFFIDSYQEDDSISKFKRYSCNFIIPLLSGSILLSYNIIEYPLIDLINRDMSAAYYKDIEDIDNEIQLFNGKLCKETFNRILLDMFSVTLSDIHSFQIEAETDESYDDIDCTDCPDIDTCPSVCDDCKEEASKKEDENDFSEEAPDKCN